MLKPGWQQEFGQLADSCIRLLSELAETAYKQGSVTRLRATVECLLKHGHCDDQHLIHLAEAGLKTSRPQLAEFALGKLIERSPQQADYLLHLASVQAAQGQFSQALATLEQVPQQFHQAPEFTQQQADIRSRQQQQLELRQLIKDVLVSDVAAGMSDQDFETHGQSILQAAINLQDHQAIIDVTVALSKRLPLEQELLIQLCQSLEQTDNDQWMGRFVLALSGCGQFPHLIRFYLEWMLNRNRQSSLVASKPLLQSIVDRHHPSHVDVVAVLLALNNDWKEFGQCVDLAMQTMTKPPVLFRYAVSYWLQNGQADKLEPWLQQAENLTANELRFFAAALEGQREHLSTRLELLQLAYGKANNDANILNDLGDALLHTGNSAEAIQCFFKAINNEQEESFYTCYNLAVTLQAEGDNRQAFDYFKRAIAVDPQQWPSWKQLCHLLVSSGTWQMAYDVARYYLSEHEDDAQIWGHLATAALKLSQIADSRTYIEQALKLKPNGSGPLTNLSLIEMACGNISEAFAANQKVLMSSSAPDMVRQNALSNMLFCGNYDPNKSEAQLYNIYRAVTGHMPRQQYFPKVQDYQGRRIRIGYVSADLKMHPVAFFVEALFEHHDRSRFEIFAYSGVGMEDHYSDMLRKHVDHWKYIGKTPDQELAEMIIEDGIDVLMDLSGHTDGNRLSLFALKPCAVQVSWLGFAHTTGMRQMDYFLGDEQLTPPSCDRYFAEKPYRLPRASYCFTPNVRFRDFVPTISRRPDKEPLVLGNLGRAIRFNTPVLKLWKRVLDAVPNSIIKIDNPNFKDQESQQMMRQRFAEHGIDNDRLWVGFTSDYWQSIVDIDIALDGFPQNSGTTLFEFLWCGTPVVSLKDRPSVGRLGAMVLHGIGRDEWIADTAEQYIEIVSQLASDRDQLHQIRSGLRQQFLDSELCDGPDFARAVEDAYVAMLKEKSADDSH
ncbi:tetratricopeptide repeat protein [Neiella sp. HB171785]|uniref:protein O-GlcNAc transferase n=1 Tax=Neiella litorisoli TaxID=2771431 RepID=A0A8J6QVR9_9GAMM|nr:tetratricopeptide repeat protein [Neiella litorisoli]MBD1390838.1 tetratricopeptide repeat protein [Neiella litorisoli]